MRREKTLAELAPLYDGHPNQITTWRTRLLGGFAGHLPQAAHLGRDGDLSIREMIAEDLPLALARPEDMVHPPEGTLHRALDWKGAFWASSGVPAGVLLTMGGIASVIGQPSWVVWIASITMGFIQSFVYAEIAGLYPHKSGGASVYGATNLL